MFKKILVVCAVGMTFINNAIFAVEESNAQQIMLPITAGTIKFDNSDFDSQGNASHYVQVTCPSPYLSPAAKYPWVMAYPSAYQVGHGIGTQYMQAPEIEDVVNNIPKPILNFSVIPKCDSGGCNLNVVFQFINNQFVTSASSDNCDRQHSECQDALERSYASGFLTITYVAYCSTQPIASEPSKPNPASTKQ